MVYSNKLIVVIKQKGKVLREFQDNIVRLPFGADYSIYIKNKDHMLKAYVDVKVDGKDALAGNSLIVAPNSSTELKGFMKGSTVRNKFRFIEKTKEISNYRGDFVEDGLVEVNYKFEMYPEIKWAKPIDFNLYGTSDYTRAKGSFNCTHSYYSSQASGSSLDDPILASCSVNESGITVPGKETRQDFVTGSIGPLEDARHNIIIQLKGRIKKSKKRVMKPITVKTKVRCSTCGRRWKSSMKYCGNCSTYLH